LEKEIALSDSNEFKGSLIFIALILGIMVVIAVSGGLVEPDKAREVLEANGYTSIEITGWKPLLASESDTYSTGFKAISPAGKQVSGAVTGGVWKGHTIRLE
jgi:hypothetical protein